MTRDWHSCVGWAGGVAGCGRTAVWQVDGGGGCRRDDGSFEEANGAIVHSESEPVALLGLAVAAVFAVRYRRTAERRNKGSARDGFREIKGLLTLDPRQGAFSPRRTVRRSLLNYVLLDVCGTAVIARICYPSGASLSEPRSKT